MELCPEHIPALPSPRLVGHSLVSLPGGTGTSQVELEPTKSSVTFGGSRLLWKISWLTVTLYCLGSPPKKNTECEEKRKDSGLPDHLPSLTPGRTDRGEWSFCPRCKFPASVRASKHVLMQYEGDPAEGSVGQDIWPSHSRKKPSSKNLQSHPSSAKRRFFSLPPSLPPQKIH